MFHNNEIKTFKPIKVKITNNPIPIADSNDLVVARVGHIPRSDTKTGFSLIMPAIAIVTFKIKLVPRI